MDKDSGTWKSELLVSVNIPTRNSASTLEACLNSVVSQQMTLEVVIADDCSTDNTREIAQEFGARFLTGPLPLLEARYQALLASRGQVIVLLDSDQQILHGALGRALDMIQVFDALILEERSLHTGTAIERLFAADKQFLHQNPELHADPATAALLPRVFRREIIEGAFRTIPSSLRRRVIAQDHALIYQRAGRLTRNIGMVEDAVVHEEMVTIRQVLKKYFRWGTDLPELFALDPEIRKMTASALKARVRGGRGSPKDRLRSLVLMGLKTPPYLLGFVVGWARYWFGIPIFRFLRRRYGSDR